MKQPERECPVELAARVTGGKWKPRLLWVLMRDGRMRFAVLRRACPPISDRILTKELKELEAWRLVERRELSAKPLATEWGMTEYGRSLEPVMAAMAAWSLRHRDATAPP